MAWLNVGHEQPRPEYRVGYPVVSDYETPSAPLPAHPRHIEPKGRAIGASADVCEGITDLSLEVLLKGEELVARCGLELHAKGHSPQPRCAIDLFRGVAPLLSDTSLELTDVRRRGMGVD